MENEERDSPDASYTAFIDAVVSAGTVWGLSDEQGWVTVPSAEDESVPVMPFWADEADAAACATDQWHDLAPEALLLDEFMASWLPGMETDGLRVGVAWTPDLEGVEVPPLELQADLESRIGEQFDDDQ